MHGDIPVHALERLELGTLDVQAPQVELLDAGLPEHVADRAAGHFSGPHLLLLHALSRELLGGAAARRARVAVWHGKA